MFTCLYIDQQATYEKNSDFYENLNDLEHFQKHYNKHILYLDQPIITFYNRIYTKIVCKIIKIKKLYSIHIVIENF